MEKAKSKKKELKELCDFKERRITLLTFAADAKLAGTKKFIKKKKLLKIVAAMLASFNELCLRLTPYSFPGESLFTSAWHSLSCVALSRAGPHPLFLSLSLTLPLLLRFPHSSLSLTLSLCPQMLLNSLPHCDSNSHVFACSSFVRSALCATPPTSLPAQLPLLLAAVPCVPPC